MALEERAVSRTAPHAEVVRARIVLLAGGGMRNVDIAGRVGVCVDVVSKWRKRFCQEGLAGLGDRPRSGRPRRFGSEVVAGVKALACEPPEARDVPLSRWSSLELAAQAVSEGLVESISSSTVRRWLHAAAIKPWRYRSWVFPRDPDFAVKAGRVLELYERRWNGVMLGPHDYVISADEKSQLQALRRCHPGLPAGPGRVPRVEFEYKRGGTLAYMAAYDVHAARLIGMVAPSTGIEPFAALVERVMTLEPYASARRVFWVVDNGSSHNGKRSVARMASAWPTAHLVHLPVHASWLNQIEIVFSVIQRKVIKPADFADLGDLADRLERFEGRYNQTARTLRLAFHPRRPDRHARTGRRPPGSTRDDRRSLTGGQTGSMKAPPESTKHSLSRRITDRARDRWSDLESIDVRFRANFAYIDGRYPDGTTLKLCRLRYGGSANIWGFAIYRASHDDYEDSYLPTGMTAGSPEDALDCACGLYLNDPTAWLPDTPTN
jgi:transposase